MKTLMREHCNGYMEECMTRKGKPYYWHPWNQEWYDVLAVGDLSIEGWVKLLRDQGFCICRVKM